MPQTHHKEGFSHLKTSLRLHHLTVSFAVTFTAFCHVRRGIRDGESCKVKIIILGVQKAGGKKMDESACREWKNGRRLAAGV